MIHSYCYSVLRSLPPGVVLRLKLGNRLVQVFHRRRVILRHAHKMRLYPPLCNTETRGKFASAPGKTAGGVSMGWQAYHRLG